MLSQLFKRVKTIYRLYILWHAWLASHIFLKTTQIMARAELPAGIGTKCFVFCILSKKPLILRCPTMKWNTKKDKAACSPFLVQHQF